MDNLSSRPGDAKRSSDRKRIVRPDPYQPPESSADSESYQRPARVITAADVLLVAGFLCTALAAGLMQFVMIGLVGLGLFIVAFGLLLAAGTLARAVGNPNLWQHVASFALYVMGVLSLIAVAAYATSLAMALRAGASAPSGWQWTVLTLISILAAAAVSIALLYRTRCSPLRCFSYWIAAFAIAPTAILIFWILKRTGQPLTA